MVDYIDSYGSGIILADKLINNVYMKKKTAIKKMSRNDFFPKFYINLMLVENTIFFL